MNLRFDWFDPSSGAGQSSRRAATRILSPSPGGIEADLEETVRRGMAFCTHFFIAADTQPGTAESRGSV